MLSLSAICIQANYKLNTQQQRPDEDLVLVTDLRVSAGAKREYISMLLIKCQAFK